MIEIWTNSLISDSFNYSALQKESPLKIDRKYINHICSIKIMTHEQNWDRYWSQGTIKK